MAEIGLDAEQMRRSGVAFSLAEGASLKRFQVLGERASGTNVIRKSLEKNTTLTRTESLGWKHGFAAMVAIPRDLLVVCAVRNAFDWLRSMHKRPWHAAPSLQVLEFSDFIRAEWHSVVDRPSDFDAIPEGFEVEGQVLQPDRHPLTGAPFENLLALRRAKLQLLRGMPQRECAVAYVQLEALTRDAPRVMQAFRSALDQPHSGPHRQVTRRMGTRYKPTIADRPQTPAIIDPHDRAFILSRLDLSLEERFGYQY